MKKNTMITVFFRGFMKSFLIIALLLGVGFGSYKLSMLYYEKVEPPKNTKTNEVIKDIVSDVKVDDISQNLIYGINEETGKITGLVLEIFNTYSYNLDYITIPVDTQFTLSNDMYQRICVNNPEAPQIIKLADLNKYFEEEGRYEYGGIIIEDLISVNISYYTVMNQRDFDSTFQDQDGIAVLSEEVSSRMSNINKKEQLEDYITEVYGKIESNLTLKNKLKYIDSFMKVNQDFIYYHILKGTTSSDYFTVEEQESNDMIGKLLSNTAYMESQESVTKASEPISSKGINIEILNGSKISGLAAKYKGKLETDGFTINHIGNYSDQAVTVTMIYVKEEGLGQDLLPYFNEATIQKAELSEGTDIQIVLGTSDQIN